MIFKVGMRVRVNERYPYGGVGRIGTVTDGPRRGSGARGDADERPEWIQVTFDDNPEYPVDWHRSYFDPIVEENTSRT